MNQGDIEHIEPAFFLRKLAECGELKFCFHFQWLGDYQQIPQPAILGILDNLSETETPKGFHRFDTSCRKIRLAAQLSPCTQLLRLCPSCPCAATTEARAPGACAPQTSHRSEKPEHRGQEWPPLGASREKPEQQKLLSTAKNK